MMQEYFEALSDARQGSKVKHKLTDIVIMVICSVIAGCDVWEDIADFCRVKKEWFKESFGMELPNGIPSHDTLERVFSMIKPSELEACFTNWVSHVCGKKDREIVSIDGKTLRRSRDCERNAIHMVSAWASEAGVVFGQLATQEKSNEITAVPQLLKTLDIEGTTVTADAMSCQKEIVKTIAEQKADYVIRLKDNQPTLYREAKEYFDAVVKAPAMYPDTPCEKQYDKGHGRIETRTFFLCTDEALLRFYSEWTNLAGIGMVKTQIIRNGIQTEETHYCITSLTNVKEMARAFRAHWGVENSLHWCLDMTFREDYSRIRKDNSAENFAVIRHIALSTLKRMNDKMSLARRRRHCAYDDAYLALVLKSIHA